MILHYVQNGGGRDLYIQSNNGGFTVHHQNSGLSKPGTMFQRSPSIGDPNAGVKYKPTQSKPIHYVQNGQGRDSYISQNHGGFITPSYNEGGKFSFFNSLRKNERSLSPRMNRSPSLKSISPLNEDHENDNLQLIQPHRDVFMESQMRIVNRNDIARLVKLSKEQRFLDRKLSQPKISPYLQHKYHSLKLSNRMNEDYVSQLDVQKAFENLNQQSKYDKIKLLMDISRSPRSQSQLKKEYLEQTHALASINQMSKDNLEQIYQRKNSVKNLYQQIESSDHKKDDHFINKTISQNNKLNNYETIDSQILQKLLKENQRFKSPLKSAAISNLMINQKNPRQKDNLQSSNKYNMNQKIDHQIINSVAQFDQMLKN